jgi:two-component system chemotaxis response regulator CheB
MTPFKAIVIGTSAGGIEALKKIIMNLEDFDVPIIIVQHLSPRHKSQLPEVFATFSNKVIKEIEEKEKIKNGIIYIAPSNYHVLIERDHTFSLTVEERYSYARPSIDILFETAADAYRYLLIGVLLTGANKDGAEGLKKIKELGGYTIVQTPDEAYAKEMPLSAIELFQPNVILSLEDIPKRLNELIKIREGFLTNER